MKKYLVLFIALVLSSASMVNAQKSSFDKDAAAWHKKAIMTCGMFKKMESFNQQTMLQKLTELEKEMKELQAKYADNPPAEYKNDPMWKMYFNLFLDNTNIIKERVEAKKYKLAKSYCGNYCKLFGRMHRNNGTTDLTDIMFATRMNIMMTMEMFSAHNFEGAKANLSSVKNLAAKYVTMVKSAEKYNELFKPVEDAVNSWIEAIEKMDKQQVKASMDKYMKVFPKAYMSTL